MLQTLGRAGYAAKGVVYCLIGAFAVQAALGRGGQVGGPHEAVRTLGEQHQVGRPVLLAIGVGLLGYALWRVIEALIDPQGLGTSGKGLVQRMGNGIGALFNGALGVVALQLAGGRSPSSSGEPDTFVGHVMRWPHGEILIAAFGAVAVGVGVGQIVHGLKHGFLRELDLSQLSSKERKWITRSGTLGLVARGVVFGVIGIFLVKAALEHRPGSAVGIGGALRTIAAQPWGLVMLLAVAFGLVCYGAFQLMLARYARLPQRS